MDQKLEDIMIDATTNAKDAGGVQFVNWVQFIIIRVMFLSSDDKRQIVIVNIC